MEIKKAISIIEAVLFASGEPVPLHKLMVALDMDKRTTVNIMKTIIDKFEDESSGVCIVRLGDNYQMCTKPKLFDSIKETLRLRRSMPLSVAAMETLAVVAYNQPVTNSFIEKVRGVDSSGIVSGLVAKDLIEEKGRLELPGRPILYITTTNFLKCFGISSLKELPKVN